MINHNAIFEVVNDDKNQMKVKSMKDSYINYPELLLIDATYKLNDLHIPLRVLMIVDGNGESEIAALWLVTSEDRDTIKQMVGNLKKYNCTDYTGCFMADKDMTERNVLIKEIPNAVLLICLFHTLRTFHCEPLKKMDITNDQQQMSLEIISKLVYSRSEDEYRVFYHQLKGMKLKLVNEYLKNTGMKLEHSARKTEKSGEIFNEQDQQQGLVYKPENQKCFGKEFPHYYFCQRSNDLP